MSSNAVVKKHTWGKKIKPKEIVVSKENVPNLFVFKRHLHNALNQRVRIT